MPGRLRLDGHASLFAKDPVRRLCGPQLLAGRSAVRGPGRLRLCRLAIGDPCSLALRAARRLPALLGLSRPGGLPAGSRRCASRGSGGPPSPSSDDLEDRTGDIAVDLGVRRRVRAGLALSGDAGLCPRSAAVRPFQVVDLECRGLLRGASGPGFFVGLTLGGKRPRSSSKEPRFRGEHALPGVHSHRIGDPRRCAAVGFGRGPPGHRADAIGSRGLRGGPLLLDARARPHLAVHARRRLDAAAPARRLAPGPGAVGVAQMANCSRR